MNGGKLTFSFDFINSNPFASVLSRDMKFVALRLLAWCCYLLPYQSTATLTWFGLGIGYGWYELEHMLVTCVPIYTITLSQAQTTNPNEVMDFFRRFAAH